MNRNKTPRRSAASATLSSAYAFIVLFGVVSLFSDMTHEGARSITGPFLSSLGLSAAAVATIAGFGELVGYALRFVSGYLSDKTWRYWLVTGIGYAVNLLSVPLLAISGNWVVAAGLMILERAGRAIRNPARDAMLSHATSETGHGKGFGLHEALDQIGATAGPLIVTAVLAAHGSMRRAFAWLLVPALAALSILLYTRLRYPKPATLEATAKENIRGAHFPKSFWLYLVASALVGVILWGIGMGAQESIMRAAIAHYSHKEKRATAYGFFNMIYGIAWFAGSAAFGLLYDNVSVRAAVIFSLVLQALAIPFFLFSARQPEARYPGENTP
jgi:MFS family permease